MTARLCACLALALAAAMPLAAEVTPQAGPGDPHIQTVTYDPQQVVGLHVANGFATTIQFSPEERIETVTLGDSAGWMVQADKRADSLVVKPVGGTTTNLTVITDARTYNFSLYAAFPGEGVQPYLVSFVYPAASPPPAAAPLPVGHYRLSGARKLWPVEISDDGAFTRIRWADGVAMPAVYRSDQFGKRALVNGVVRDGAYVIEGVYPRIYFLLGHDRAQAKRHTPVARGEP